MCGICGLIPNDGRERPDPALLTRMVGTLAHRGPDDEGVWTGAGAGIAARRLAIIGLKNGRQPIASEDGRTRLVCNGEIFNYKELRKDLLKRGHRFSTDTDVETILHLYEEVGDGVAERLEGQFAFALWDGRKKRLLLGRDRLGQNPLFVHEDGWGLRFASEIKAILEDPKVPRRPDLTALHDYLSLDYVPRPRTAFMGIGEVAPGHLLTWREGRREERRYWNLRYEPGTKEGAGSRRKMTRAFRETFRKACEERLMSEVPVGVLLSGGLDSGAIVAFVRGVIGGPLKTFSVGFREKDFSELDRARLTARHFKTDHRELLLTPEDALSAFPEYLEKIDEPFADGSAIATYLICRRASEEVTVLLSGEGGDECLAGYDTHAAWRAASLYRRLPKPLRQGLVLPMVNRLPVSRKKLSFEFKAKRFAAGAGLSVPEGHFFWREVIGEEEKSRLLSPEAREGREGRPTASIFRERFEERPGAGELNRLLYIDSKVYLPGDLLVKGDRMSMAHSVELRMPFTDRKVVELLSRLPESMKLRGFGRKYVLKEALRGLLPREIVRGKKIGFDMPLAGWLRGPWRPLLDRYLSREALGRTGLFEPSAVRPYVSEHLAGRANHFRLLWGLINYVAWWEMRLGGRVGIRL